MRRFLIALYLTFFAVVGHAALSVDKVSNSGTKGASPFTWTHQIESTGTNKGIVIVCGNDVGSGSTPVTISSVTYATYRCVLSSRATNGFIATEIWTATGPLSGNNTISVTFTGTTGAADFMACGAISFYGMDQTTPIDVKKAAWATSGTSSATVTASADQEYLVDITEKDDTGAYTLGTSQVAIFQLNQATQFARIQASYKGPISLSPASMSETFVSIRWGQLVAAVKAAAAAGGSGRTRRAFTIQ